MGFEIFQVILDEYWRESFETGTFAQWEEADGVTHKERKINGGFLSVF